MKCDGCVFAWWKRTKSGSLHQDRSGQCTYLAEHPLQLRLPAAFYWMAGHEPSPNGGIIERGWKFAKPCVFRKTLEEA